MSGVMRETLESEGGSMRGDEDFFSVARTIPLVAVYPRSVDTQARGSLVECGKPFIPREVTPWLTAFNAYSKSMLASVSSPG